MGIQPGSTVKVIITSRIKTAKAQKTLARLFLKDEQIFKSRDHDPKPVDRQTRAGRIWSNRKRGSVARPPEVGDSATVLATVDVIRDIQSVETYVDAQ